MASLRIAASCLFAVLALTPEQGPLSAMPQTPVESHTTSPRAQAVPACTRPPRPDGRLTLRRSLALAGDYTVTVVRLRGSDSSLTLDFSLRLSQTPASQRRFPNPQMFFVLYGHADAKPEWFAPAAMALPPSRSDLAEPGVSGLYDASARRLSLHLGALISPAAITSGAGVVLTITGFRPGGMTGWWTGEGGRSPNPPSGYFCATRTREERSDSSQ